MALDIWSPNNAKNNVGITYACVLASVLSK